MCSFTIYYPTVPVHLEFALQKTSSSIRFSPQTSRCQFGYSLVLGLCRKQPSLLSFPSPFPRITRSFPQDLSPLFFRLQGLFPGSLPSLHLCSLLPMLVPLFAPLTISLLLSSPTQPYPFSPFFVFLFTCPFPFLSTPFLFSVAPFEDLCWVPAVI